jgi:peroxiredoxin
VRTIDIRATGKPPTFVYVIRVLMALCLGLAAWFLACRKTSEANKKAAQPSQPTSGHFTGKVHFDLLAKLLDDDRRGAPANEWLRELADPKAAFRVKTGSHPLLGHAAADFTLPDHCGRTWCLHGQVNHGPVVLVFYLGYGCTACVHHLFELNADLERFHSLGAEVVAVSGDSPGLTQERFREYGAFRFPVLSDAAHVVAQSYGMFRAARASESEELLHGTFLIGRDGTVRWASYGETPFRNNKALLYELARPENKLPQSESMANAERKQ